MKRAGTSFEGVPARTHDSGRFPLRSASSDRSCAPIWGQIQRQACRCRLQNRIGVARTKLIQEADRALRRHRVFVERFDYERRTRPRFHMLTLAGAFHRLDPTYSDLLLGTRTLTTDHQQVLEGILRMLFNVRSGNADDHGKNHSFIFDIRSGLWRFSPAYDVTLNLEPGRDYDGLSRQSFGNTPTPDALAETAADAGVQRQEFHRIDSDVQRALAAWPEMAAQTGLKSKEISHIQAIHQSTAKELARSMSGQERKRRRRNFAQPSLHQTTEESELPRARAYDQ